MKHIVYDAVSSSETLDAFEAVYGERALVIMIFKATYSFCWCRFSW
jgi:hypothetical protein